MRPKFSSALPAGRTVVVREVEVRDAEVERAAHDRALRVVGAVVTEVVPEAQRQGREFQAAAADSVVPHVVVTFRVRDEVHRATLW